MATPRFGLIPLPVANSADADPGEFMLDPAGHVYIKGQGVNISKTLELENRLLEIENRAKSFQNHFTLSGALLLKSLVLPTGVTSSLVNGVVKLSGATSLTNAQIKFDKKYCGFIYSPLESYFMSMDVDGIVKEATMLTNSIATTKLKSSLARNNKSKVNQKISSIIYNSDDTTISEVEPVIYIDLSGGTVSIRSIVINRMDFNMYNPISIGDALHIDCRYGDSSLLDKAGVVIDSASTDIRKRNCFKIAKVGTTNTGYLKVYVPNNIIKPGRYAMQLVVHNPNHTNGKLNITSPDMDTSFKVDLIQYTPVSDGTVLVNLTLNWNYANYADKDMPYILITAGSEIEVFIESMHIVRAYPASYSDNSLWRL